MRLLEIVRGKNTSRSPRDRHRGRPQAISKVRCGRRLPRLRRQPHALGARHEAESAARRRAAAGSRRRADRLRLPDGPVRDERSRGPRHRWRMRQARGARAKSPTPCASGPLRQKTGKGFYPYGGWLAPDRSGGLGALIFRPPCGTSVPAAISPPKRVPPGAVSMTNEGARILEEGIARLRRINVIRCMATASGLPRRPDVLGRHRGPEEDPRPADASSPRRPGDKRHEPAALLNKLADEGGTFASYGTAKAA